MDGSRTKLWKCLQEMVIPPELCSVVIRLYRKVIATMYYNSEWSMDINCNNCVKQGCHFLPPFLVSISII
jgi:hypothetical protein